MNKGDEMMWVAKKEYYEQTRLYQWMKELQFESYDDFYRKSIDDIQWFWQAAEEKVDFRWEKKYERVLDQENGLAFPKWYVGGTCNVIVSALLKWTRKEETRQRQALRFENENGDTEQYTYEELFKRVESFAAGLRELGLKKGDRVVLYMPLIPENIISFLSVMYCGAIVVPVFSGFGQDALASRITGCGAAYIITSEKMNRRGKSISMVDNVEAILAQCNSVQKVIVHRREKSEKRYVSWSELEKCKIRKPYEEMNSDDPLMLIYTSGTTGKPKGTVHVHSGFPIKAAVDGAFGLDIREGDCVCWITDMGWMMGPFLVFATLLNGATMVLYDGATDYPNDQRLWEVIQNHRLTHLGISPTLIRSLMATTNVEKIQLATTPLRVFASTGEPWNPTSWEWLFHEVGKGKIPIFNYSGGTEISGGILGNVLVKDITAATFNAALLGMAAEVRDEEGQLVQKEVGELCLTKPWVGMTKSFWQDDTRYIEAYWSKFPNTWVHGDWVYFDEGYWTITGRSDDTLNIAGKRIGPTDYESLIGKHEDVLECGTIGIPHSIKGEVACCFVVLKHGEREKEEVRKELLNIAVIGLGKALVPAHIYFVDDLPKTRNGKVMRRLMKRAYMGEEYGDISSLVNANVLTMYEQLGKERQRK
ncbi:MAG: AMP-binding protein [Bacillaceae bacterium]